MYDIEQFERYPLMFGPSPIEKLSRLSHHLNKDIEIYAKREDCNSGLAGGGGSKIRKLEYIVPLIIESGADTIVTIGAIQSNHTRQVASVAAKLGLKCHLVQEQWASFNDSIYDRTGNILLSRLMGANIEIMNSEPISNFDFNADANLERAADAVKSKGGIPYIIPQGASAHPYGGIGYVAFADEVRAQEKDMGVVFDYIVVCSVSGSTQAGMIVGFAGDTDRSIVGIDCSAKPKQTRAKILKIMQRTATFVHLKTAIDHSDLLLLEDYAYPSYGVPSKETNETIRLVAQLEGMILDPIYEGKSMQALIDLAIRGFFSPKANVLFVHLGGSPAINAYSYLYRDSS